VPTSRILGIVKQMPGVAAVAASTSVPFLSSGPFEPVSADAAGARALRAERASIDPQYFTTIDVPMRAGRGFTSSDSADTRTAIVNELLAARLFPEGDATGRQVWISGVPYEVVGVVAQYLNATLQPRERDPKVFVPLATTRTDAKAMTFVVRASADPSPVAIAMRREIRNAAGGNVVGSLFTLDQIIAVGSQETLVGTAPLAPLIATGMLLTAAGIYGVLAFAIARRSKEFALRVAIGGIFLLPLLMMPATLRYGLGDFVNSTYADPWSYIMVADYLSAVARGAEGGLSSLHQYASHLMNTRNASSATWASLMTRTKTAWARRSSSWLIT